MADATNPYPTQRTRIKEGYLGRVSRTATSGDYGTTSVTASPFEPHQRAREP